MPRWPDSDAAEQPVPGGTATGRQHLRRRPVPSTAANGPGPGGANALTGLQAVGRALPAWVIPTQAGVPQAWQVFDPAGGIHDSSIEERLRAVGREVTRFAYLHSSDRAREFLREWEEAPRNPGGEVVVAPVPAAPPVPAAH